MKLLVLLFVCQPLFAQETPIIDWLDITIDGKQVLQISYKGNKFIWPVKAEHIKNKKKMKQLIEEIVNEIER